MSDIEYRRMALTEAETDNTIDIIKDFVGDQFYVIDDSRTYLRSYAGHYAFGAFHENRLIAIIFGRILHKEEMSYYQRLVSDFIMDDILLNDLFDKRGGAINVFTIAKDLPSNFLTENLDSIVTELTSLMVNILKQSVDIIIVDLPQEKNNMLFEARLKNFNNNQFERFGVVSGFWNDYTVEREESFCSICGEHCTCDAIILYKRNVRE